MKGFIVSADHFTQGEQTYVRFFGRLENKESFVAIKKFNPYFYIKKEDLKKVKKLLSKFEIEDTPLKNFDLQPLVKIRAKSSTELNKLYKAIYKKAETYEADVRPHQRFMMDQEIQGSITIHGNAESAERVDRVYNEPDITSSDFTPTLKVLSIDIESDKTADTIYCVGLYSESYKKNLMVTKKTGLKNTISCETEEECLEKVKEEIIKLDPDIITGWNFIDFDLKELQLKFRKHKIPFNIGRTTDETRLKLESNFFRNSKATITGRQALDGQHLIRDPFIQGAPSMKNAQFENFTLQTVSKEILGEGKLITSRGRHKEITDLYKKQTLASLQKLVDYNIQDCKLVYDILKKKKIIELSIERSQLTGLQLDKLTGSVAAFDSLYIRTANKKGLASKTTHFGNKEERIKGGYVFSAEPGIYHNVLILDFKSLYPSIMKTFNIDPASYLEKKKKGSIETPNKAHFKNEEGVLPEIIDSLFKAREKAKKEERDLSSYAIKIIMNSFFGVLASPSSRYFNLQIGNAITHFGQFLIKLTAEEIEKQGYKVIYSDTDSVFVETSLDKEKANKVGKKIESHINSFYDKYVKEKYKRKSFLELEFEKQYLSMMLPKIRGESEKAAKKRYAGLKLEKDNKESLEIVGLEAIRGDWTEAAQDFQKEILLKVFKKEEVAKFVNQYIKNIKSGKLDKKLIYRKSLRKKLEDYTKTTPPHVKAARKLKSLNTDRIEYYITLDGPEPAQELKHKIDYDHYINKQIKPIADQILVLLGKDFEDILKGSKQAKLF